MKPYRAKNKNNPELTLQKEQKLYQLYEKDRIGAFDAYKSCKNVIVFGEPGCGRSTVINSILGHKLKSVPDPHGSGAFRIDLVNPDRESQLEISHDSQAAQEKLTPIPYGDITIWECPTLCENIDDKVQMDEFPKVMQLLKTLDSIKFIYVTEYEDIFGGCRGQNFSFAVDVVSRIFSNIDIIEKSILLVVTKAPPGSGKNFIEDRIYEMAHVHEIPKNTKTMMQYFKASSIYVFSTPEKEGEVEGPRLKDIAGLSFCNVSQSIQYPRLSESNQELALNMLQELQEEEAKQQLKLDEIDMENISNAGFFIKVVDFLYATLSGMSILSKAGQYAGEILMAFSSFIGLNNFNGYSSSNKSNKMEVVPENDYSPQPMSPGKIKLAKCLVKMLNENENLREEFKEKFNKYIEKYTQCKNDEEKQSIVKQFSEWIISETNLKNELAKSHISDESYNSSESSKSSDDEKLDNKPVDLSAPGQNDDKGNEAQKKELEVNEPDQGEDASTPRGRGTQAIEQSSGTPNQQDRENNDNCEMESNNNDSPDDKNVGRTIDKVANNSGFDSDLDQVVVKELESSSIPAKLGQVEDDKKPNDHEAREPGSNFIQDQKDSGQSNSSATQPNNHEENFIDILRAISAPNTDVQEALYDLLGNLNQELNPSPCN